MTTINQKSKAREFFTGKYVRPVKYKEFFNKFYKEDEEDWRTFDIGSIAMDVKDAYDVDLSLNVRDKISATATSTLIPHTFFVNAPFFEKCILAFNDMFIDTVNQQVCEPEELAYGLVVAREILKPQEFSEEVIKYIQGCCTGHRGLLVYHSTFKFAQPKFKNPNPVVEETIKNFSNKVFKGAALEQKDKLDFIDIYIKKRMQTEKEVLDGDR